MPSPEDPAVTYDVLRRLAAENPREARLRFAQLFGGDPAALEAVLERMAAPGEGRLRQLVANAVRVREDRARLAPHFSRWLDTETDEFARRAITAALANPTPTRRRPTSPQELADPRLAEVYRYVSGRMAHELRNGLLGPKTRLLHLRTRIERIGDSTLRSDLQELLAQLGDDFHGLGRIVEFEPDDEYFAFRPVRLCDWIETMNGDYARRYNRIDLQIEGLAVARAARVLGSDYLLRITFWNLWLNAHQAAGDPCTVRLVVDLDGGQLRVLILDNGDGFPAEMVDVAFQDRFSRNGPHRGRGLLEVQDAVQRLHGDARLVPHGAGALRVRLSFPCVSP